MGIEDERGEGRGGGERGIRGTGMSARKRGGRGDA